jgi:cell division protein ZipA
MNELRWILLIAGALLIAGIYFWGLRSRGRDESLRRPAAFVDPPPRAAEEEPVDAVARPTRRVEPSMPLDDAALDTQRPAIERRAEFEVDDDDAPGMRREPTFDRQAEPAGPVAGARQEPAFGSRIESAARQPSAAPRDELSPRAEPVRATEPPVRAETSRPMPSPVAPPAAAPTSEQAKPKRPPQKILAVRVSATGAPRLSGQRILEALQAEGLQFGRYEIFHSLHRDGRPVFSVASLRDPGTFDPQTMADTQYPGILVFTVLPGPVSASEAFDDMLFTARALATHLDGALADDKGVPLTAHRAGRLREEALEFERSVHAA